MAATAGRSCVKEGREGRGRREGREAGEEACIFMHVSSKVEEVQKTKKREIKTTKGCLLSLGNRGNRK